MKKVLLVFLLTNLLSSCLIVHVNHKGNCGLPKYKPVHRNHHK